MNIKEMADLATTIIGESIGPIPVDVRTIRYYETYGVMEKPQKKGRENDYGLEHLKRLLAIKASQSKGASLTMIRHLLDVTKIDMDDILRNAGIDPVVMEAFVEAEAKKKEVARDEREDEEMKGATRTKTSKREAETALILPPEEGDKSLGVTITNHLEFGTMRDRLLVGSTFAFIDGPADEVSKSIYSKLYGQLKKPKAMPRAVIHVDDRVDLLGCSIGGRQATHNGLCVLVPDKDCYKEGDDVACVFVFDPNSRGGEIKLNVSLSGVPLDVIEVDLDDNGCGLARVPTLVAGRYDVVEPVHGGKCVFEASRYELDPLSVSVSSSRKSPEGIEIDLDAKRFGKTMAGKAIVRIVDDGTPIAEKEVLFVDGECKTTWPDLGTGNASIQLTPADDKSLVASCPIPGSRKKEREDTVVARMGRVISSSLISSAGAESERGVHFSEDGVANSPIRLESVICRGGVATLKFSAGAENVTVSVEDPSSGALDVHYLGKANKGSSRNVKVNSAFALLSVGAFVGGRAWEGNAAVVRASSKGFRLSIPGDGKFGPGDEVEMRLSSDEPCSVLLKISDARVRAMYEPMLAIASRAKSWMSKSMLGLLTGNAWKPVVNDLIRGIRVKGASGVTGPSGSFGTFGHSVIPSDPSDLRATGGGWVSSESMNSILSYNEQSTSYRPGPIPARSSQAYYVSDLGVSAGKAFQRRAAPARLVNAEVKTHGGIVLHDSVGADEMIAVEDEVETRKSEADVVFCDLFRVPKSGRKIKIKLPDRIAGYDVKAFFVNGEDWGEVEEKMACSKPLYVEPLIPPVASREDVCRAVVVNGAGCDVSVKVDGSDVEFEKQDKGLNVLLRWQASPGVHEVIARKASASDKVSRIVEPPGEEIVLCQETRVLAKGKKYGLEPGALSVHVIPGMKQELDAVVHVTLGYEHSCCEQTAAKIVAALVVANLGDDGKKAEAYKSIINGRDRLRHMYDAGAHAFRYYPGYSVNEWASAVAARRVAKADVKGAPKDVSTALADIRGMAEGVASHSSYSSPMEQAFLEGKFSAVTTTEAFAASAAVKGGSSMAMAEAAYSSACLLKSGRLDEGIEVANVVAKAMSPAMGGGMRGTNDLLAYLMMVMSLQESGIVPGTGGKVVVDGEKMTVSEASGAGPVSKVEATENAVAIRINRVQKIKLDEETPAVPIEVRLVGLASKAVKAGKMARLVVRNTGGYKAGDVVVVRLPQCLSRVVGGGKQKKFQVDFEGKDEVSIDLVAHDAAKQKMAVVVRNMYDAERIGSAGLIDVSVA